MYFTELVWHNILEFRYGKRPFGFWKWKSLIYKALKNIDKKHQRHYWSSTNIYIYDKTGMLDFCIYKIKTYDFDSIKRIHHVNPTENIFIDKKYRDEFSKTLLFK